MKFLNLSILVLVLSACDAPSPVEHTVKAVAEGTDEVFALKNKEAIDEAVMMDKLQVRGDLTFIPNTEEPYSGFAKKLFDNDQLEFLIKFTNGYISAVKSWRSNGSPQNYIEVSELAYDVDYFDSRWSDGEFPLIEDDTKIIRKIVLWHENSQISSVQLFTDEGHFGGKLDYFKNGQKSVQTEMKEDLVWNAKTWKPSGELVEEAVVDGTGKCTGYHDNGILSFKQTFKNGMFDGLSIFYYEDGSISSEGTYKDGKLTGDSITYNEDGSMRFKMTYKDGELNGDFIHYKKDGSIRSKETYKDGELIESSSN